MKIVFAVSGVLSALLWLTISPSFLVYVTIFLLLWIAYMKLNESFERMKKIGFVGPEPIFLLGNLPDYMKEGFFNFELNTYKKYKNEGRKFYVTFSGRIPILYLTDLDMIKQVTIKEASSFTDRMVFGINSSPLDLNLLALCGDHWKHVRSQVTPTFSSGKLKNMTPLIKSAVDKLVKNVLDCAQSGKEMDIKSSTSAYTLDVIASTLFGLDIDSQKNPDDVFVVNVKKILRDFGGEDNSLLLLSVLFPEVVPYIKNLRLFNSATKDAIHFLTNVVDQCLKERKASNEKYRDFLQMMVDSEVGPEMIDRTTHSDQGTFKWSTKGLTRGEIMGQVLLFFIAGYDTTANTLVFLLYLLSVYPDVQEKVVSEISEQLGDEPANYDNVGKLTYMDMCINETLRIYTPLPRTDRVAVRTVEIGGLVIPKGQVVGIPVVGIHGDPEYWEEPEKFIPERFSAEARARHHIALHQPFGIGPRNCIGMRLAMLEMKMVMVEVLRQFQILASEGTPRREDLKMSKTGFSVPEIPIKVKFSSRY